MCKMVHQPVLTREVVEYLSPKKNENFIDCTIGEGGHSLEILKLNGPKGKVLGLDWDLEQIENAKVNLKDFEERLILINDNYANLEEIVKRKEFSPVNGILADLGMSSWQIGKKGRGFSFQEEGPLDMRYNPENELKAETILNYWSEQEIAKILEEYGEERFSKRIAKAIAGQRKIKFIKTTGELREIIRRAVPSAYKKGRISLATRTFQALRIAVNDELKNLKDLLPQAVRALAPKGKLAIISFHSLEDRIVKRYFKNHLEDLNILTPKPIRAGREEQKNNVRARSAKLRVAEKI